MDCQYATNCPPPPPPPLHGGIGTAASFHGLPFTGADVLIWLLAGMVIILAGAALRWYTR